MNVFAIGASRNIGYYASLSLLAKGDTVTFLLRSKATLENDENFKPHIASGKATLVKGDAMSYDDVLAAWKAASSQKPVDLLLFTVGAVQASFHLTKGFIVTPGNLCTTAILNVQRAIVQTGSAIPKIVVLSSTGLTRQSKAVMPLLLRPLYGWALHTAHEDKRGLETVIHHGIGKPYEEGETPGETILPAGWQDGLPAAGWAKHSVIIRAAWLTDGEATGRYRSAVGDFKAYTIGRRDVAHFITEELLVHWEKYDGNIVTIGY